MRFIFSLPTWVNPQVYLRISAGLPGRVDYLKKAGRPSPTFHRSLKIAQDFC
jgi:hypothetical protein